MNKSYSAIANYYDSFTHNDCDYTSWSQYLFEVAKKHKAKKVVDLACGTGKMTSLLAKKGLQVIGVDNSNDMLCVARDKCNCLFVCQDMQKLKLPSLVDMAVCVNDGVNYLAPQALEGFFVSVCANLKSGAPFVFDVSSPYKLQQVVGNNVFYIDEQNQTLLWTNSCSDNVVKMNLTLFTRQGETYIRHDENHTQYLHTVEQIQTALANSGFCLHQVTADYGKPLQQASLRITFYATKNN